MKTQVAQESGVFIVLALQHKESYRTRHRDMIKADLEGVKFEFLLTSIMVETIKVPHLLDAVATQQQHTGYMYVMSTIMMSSVHLI